MENVKYKIFNLRSLYIKFRRLNKEEKLKMRQITITEHLQFPIE